MEKSLHDFKNNGLLCRILFAFLLIIIGTDRLSAQNITLNFQEAKMSEVMEAISEQTGLQFVYSQPVVNPNQIISIHAEEEELNYVLRALCGRELDYEISDGKIYLKPNIRCGGMRVSGYIKDAEGEPIIGANVHIAGSQAGTISDLDGYYFIEVPPEKKIAVSYIGYITQTLTPKKELLNIILQEDTRTLDEVVVVGYGFQKMRNVTGSVSTLSVDNIDYLPVSTLAEAMEGQLNGVSVEKSNDRPGTFPTLNIRHANRLDNLSSANLANIPLVVIDDMIQLSQTGSPTLEQFNLLDLSEVESITVLRDASASIYGSRASGGVILVKTQRGKYGRPKVSYTGKLAYNEAISHSKVLTGSDYGRFANSYTVGAGLAKNHMDLRNLYSENEIKLLDNLNYNWLDKAWDASLTHNHSVNVSGGTDKLTYFAGASYFNQGANLGDVDYERFTYRTGVDISVFSNLKFSASLSGNTGDRKTTFANGARFNAYGGQASRESEYRVLHHMPRHIPWSVQLTDERGNRQTYWTGPTANTYRTPSWNNNSVTSWNYFAQQQNGSYSIDENNSWSANFSLVYNIPAMKGLSLRATYATTRTNNVNEQASLPYQLAYLKNPNQQDGHLESEWEPLKDNYHIRDFTSNSQIRFYDLNTTSTQLNAYINYERSFGKHTVEAMGSIERGEMSYSSRQLVYDGLPADAADLFRRVGNSALSDYLSTSNSVSTRGETGTLSYLGRIHYNYDDKYMLQFIFRSDASTKFAPNNYWGFFPGISAGWIISSESWFHQRLPWINYLKMRMSWGQTGRDNVNMWQWKQFYNVRSDGVQFGPNGGQASGALQPERTPNPQLKWDTTDKFNLGFDMRFFGSRLGATLDLYYDINDRILNKKMAGQVGIPIYAGGAYAEENYGRIDTYGAELSINWQDKIGHLNYYIGMDISLDGNRIKKWPAKLRYNQYDSSSEWSEGMSTILPYWGFKTWKGTSAGDGILRTQEDIDNYWNYLTEHADAAGTTPAYFGNEKENLRLGMLAYQDLGGEMVNGVQQIANGRIEKEQDYAKLCDKNRDYGFTTRLGGHWKNLSFHTVIFTSWNGISFIDCIDIKSGNGNMLWTPDSFWKDMFDPETNPDGQYPNVGANRQIDGSVISPSDFWTVGTFRCYVKNLSISYTLLGRWLAPAKVESATISLSGNNLWDFYNPFPDHYRNMYDSSYSDYPTLRTWSFGIKLTF